MEVCLINVNSNYKSSYFQKKNNLGFGAKAEILKKVGQKLNNPGLIAGTSLGLLVPMSTVVQDISSQEYKKTEMTDSRNKETSVLRDDKTKEKASTLQINTPGLSEEELKTFIQEELNGGKPLYQIARELNIPQSKIPQIKKSLGVKKMSPVEIQHYELRKILSASPEKQRYLSILTKFPELSLKYKQFLSLN